jgi:hypothetical protein
MKRIIGIIAVAIALNSSAILSAQALNTTPLNAQGQPVGGQPVTGTLGRNTTISSSINPGATSIRATTLEIHPSYNPPVPTTPGMGTLGRNTTISSSINPYATSIVATTLQIHPNYTPPIPTTPLNTFGQPVPVVSAGNEFRLPVAIGAPSFHETPVPTFGFGEPTAAPFRLNLPFSGFSF